MRLAPIFHDHAVLQRDIDIPVWGVTGPNQTVTVTLAGKTAKAVAGADGAWLVRLPPLPAGGPHELVASSDSGSVRVADVLIGEVWVCSGQSNMQWKLGETSQQVPARECDLPRIRLLSVGTPATLGRSTAIDGRWTPAVAKSLDLFSAVGGWFGRELHRALGVPVGLICNAWGGTRVQAWISREALVQDPGGRDEVRHYEGYVFNPEPPTGELYTSMADWEARGPHQDAGNAGLASGWAGNGFDDSGWKRMPLPARWQDHGHPGSGIFWFRRTVDIPAAWAGKDLELHLGAIDKHDDTYVNGERVGGLSWADGGNTWCTLRNYTVPARLVSAGALTIAVRARSHVFHGGLIGPSSAMLLHPVGDASAAIPLATSWAYRIEQDWGMQNPPTTVWGPGNQNSPYTLFDSRLWPLIPYAIRGAIWYQGESNAAEADVYRRLMPLMIRDWRRAWGQGDFPFIQVQLANYMPASEDPGPSDWAELRDAQLAATAEPATGMAVAIDVGDANDIHPRDKKSVGQRLARWALANTYGQAVVAGGPLFAVMVVEGAQVRCRFSQAAGLRTRDGKAPSHVDIAGLDRTFVRAQTRIEGETLVAWSPKVPRPAAVRYAWANNPAGCNLVNSEDLPASPFRSDAWRR
ncbi:MAG: 9-O-acetylesterase [Planctomycetes bacterium]|nr:9-O-acetylesterase [Planctomycetota bacterium]